MVNNVYHGIIVKESLNEKIIKNLKILGEGQGKDFLLLKIEVPIKLIEKIINIIQKSLKVKYYAHFFRENELIIVYKDKIFYITPNKTTWKAAVDYGLSIGIPLRQLSFKPCKFEEETY